ncbi:HalOD1 output domain-containing protein [Halorussus halophilus]|uniref:HalOD1 output domain-containing protein n=1 Tax=Halorussus halophilus TaxID=2650975 RepID=UPI001300E227|nr:HalOD1 output domain-containing protein [Halorussus halophilus]
MKSELASKQVVDAVAAEEGVSPHELAKPLYEVVNTDALNDFFAGPTDGGSAPIQITFEYHGYEVSVESDDQTALTVQVEPAAKAEPKQKTGADD